KILPANPDYSIKNEIDAEGRILAPGFIDIHIQGAGGCDILDGTAKSLETLSSTLAKLGTTGYLGTSVFMADSENNHLNNANKFFNKSLSGATLLGVHLEGPFINPKKKGGLSKDAIFPPSKDVLNNVLEKTKDSLKLMTLAPELIGNKEIIIELLKNNIIPSFGHSDANYIEAKESFEIGIKHATHIFNAMNPIHHREPGPITAIFENPEVTSQIISDGHHLHPAIVNLIYKNTGYERCICITDGMQAMGLPEGNYLYNNREYVSKNGAAKYHDGTLIGSTTSLGNIAYKFMEFTGCTIKQAIDTITFNPAKLLNLETGIGSIQEGLDADLVILDKKFSALVTLVKGFVVHDSLYLHN
ncbi:MAG: N-acetylglucosamine-6-phosphate deacetylase, partial [Bacteroidota bacterium]|nr:N-acetylglucosamine-6-phosphate deacetylase [Bacteroidota bacterium]